MTPTLTAVAVAAFTLIYFSVLGYPVAVIALPERLRPWFWVCLPVLGLVVAAVGLGWLVLVLPGGVAGLVLLALAAVATVAASLRGARPPASQHWREQALAGVCGVVGVLVALAPLVGRPDLIAIGPNWDIEIYLPMAAYLRDAPLGFALDATAGLPFPGPTNPLLWRVNFFDPRWSGLTFQELHAAIDGLTALAPHDSFTGLMAALFGLTPVASFLLARAGMRTAGWASLGAALLVALGTPGLFVVYWSFGQQVSALPLAPLAVLLLLVAVNDRDRHGWWLAGAAAAALLASYVPAVPVYLAGAVAVALGGALRPGRLIRVLGVSAAAAVAALVLAPWAVLRCIERARHFLADQGVTGLTVGPDVYTFPPLGWSFGLYPSPAHGFAGLLQPGEGPSALHFGLLSLVTVGAIALWRRGELSAALLSLAPIAILLPLRFLAPYPYGYMKTVPFTSPVVLGLLAAGLAALWALDGRWMRLRRTGLAVAALALLAVNLSSVWHYVGDIGTRSTMAYRGLDGLDAAVAPGSRVYVSGHKAQWGPKGGAIAYALRDAELDGYLATGFSSFYRDPQGRLDFALFSAEERPWPEVFGDTPAPVWAGLGLALYQAPAGLQAFRLERAGAPPVVQRSGGQGGASGLRITEWTAEGYPEFAGWSPPLLGALADITPPEVRYPMVSRGVSQPVEPLPAARAGYRETRITLGSLRRQAVSVRAGSRVVELDVPVGLSTHSLGSVPDDAELRVLDNDNQAPLWVRSVARWSTAGPAGRHADAVLVTHEARLAGTSVAFNVSYTGPALKPVVDIYSEDGTVHYGYWVLGEARAGLHSYRLRLDTEEHVVAPQRRDGSPPFESFRGEAPDGDYRMYLMLWKGGIAVDQIPLCTFTLKQRRAVSVTPEPGDIYIG